MKRCRVEGRCEVSTKRGYSLWLPRDQFQTVRAAWLKGAQFIDTVDFHGATLTIKLKDIEIIADVPAKTITARIEEDRLNEADDSLAGGAV